MIDFRYHLVSIVAIFLALATGIVLGTTYLQEPALESAKGLVESLTAEKSDLRAQLDVERSRQRGNDSFVSAVTPQLVAGDLTGQRIVMVEAAGANTTIREAQQLVLEQAGAVVTGRITLTEKFVDPKRSGLLDELVTTIKPSAITFPASATPYDKAGILLAAALVTNDAAQAGTVNTAAADVLASFEQGGFLTVEKDPAKRATTAMVFAPEKPYEGESAEVQANAIVSVASGLDAGSKGTVVGGNLASATAVGGVIAALRDNNELVKTISSDDSIDMPAGRVVVVFALQEQLAGESGQYGLGADSSAFQPPIPTPSPTPTSSGS